MILIDTTLREGQQHGQISFDVEQAVELARLLDQFGAGMIEVGHPAISKTDWETARRVCDCNLQAATLAHARALESDVAAAAEVGAKWVGIFAGVNEMSLRSKFHKSRVEVDRLIERSILAAKRHGLLVRFTCEDASRTENADVTRVFRRAIDCGADRVSFADTVGRMTPDRMQRTIAELTERFGQVVHVHCHNDFGLATANTLAGYLGGAVGLDVSIDGVGERSGIASLAEVAAALVYLLGETTDWQMELLSTLSAEMRVLWESDGIDTRPIVGRYAFAHKAGLHVAAELEDPRAYEPIAPEDVGQARHVVFSRLLGPNTRRKMQQLVGESDPSVEDVRVP